MQPQQEQTPPEVEYANPLQELLEKPISSTRVCNIVSTEAKHEVPLIRFARRVKQTMIHKEVMVRYDSAVSEWAVIDSEGNPIRHFNYGHMTDVKFSTMVIAGYGCNDSKTVGVATGNLIENKHSKDASGMRNFKYNGSGFTTENGHPINDAKVVQLLPERHAMFK